MITPALRARALGNTVILACPCGSGSAPRPVAERAARKLPLVRLRCPDCRLTSQGARLDRAAIAWNLAVETHKQLHPAEDA